MKLSFPSKILILILEMNGNFVKLTVLRVKFAKYNNKLKVHIILEYHSSLDVFPKLNREPMKKS